MPTQTFALDQAKTETVTINWRGIWKDVTVAHNGTKLGEPFANLAALKQGRDFTLPGGRTLNVKFDAGFGKNRLELTVDGRPVAGSGSDPRVEHKLAYGVIWFVAGLSALLGVLGMTGVAFLAQLGFGWPSLVAGAVFAVLGYFVRQKSRVALALAIALFAVDGVITLAASMDGGGRVPTTAIIMRVLLILPMIRGFSAIKRVEDLEKQQQLSQAF